MSDADDPFARRDRTIIRPNPGGRLPQPPAPPPSPAGPPSYPPQAPASSPWGTPQGGAPPSSRPLSSVSYPSAPPQPAPFSTGDGKDAWLAGRQVNPYMPGQAAIAPLTPAPASPHVSVDLEFVADNPLMRAAASLLLTLGRLRVLLSRAGAGPLMDQMAQAIEVFERDALKSGAPDDQVRIAKYALAATADDIVQNLPSDDRHIWARYSMLVRFFNEREGGTKFFTYLNQVKQNAAVNVGLLELMHACLSLGFEGVHRVTGGAGGALQGLRRDLYETIRRARAKTIEDLSPHWRGQTIALAGTRIQIPAWAVAAAAAALLLGVYLFLRYLLNSEAEALALKVSNFYPDTQIQLGREAPKPPPAPVMTVAPQLVCVRKALGPEILAGKVSAEQTSSTIFVRVGSVVLFPSGGASANATFAPIAQKIAAALDKQPGNITVTGYTDSDPIKTVAFPSNFELSEARAKSAAALLKPSLANPQRLVVKGKGASEPVAPNDVEGNKSRNRRVEFSIPRDDSQGC